MFIICDGRSSMYPQGAFFISNESMESFKGKLNGALQTTQSSPDQDLATFRCFLFDAHFISFDLSHLK